MSKTTVLDGYEAGQQKIKLEQAVIKAIINNFPNHRIGTPRHPFRSYYVTYSDIEGKPSRKLKIDGDLFSSYFGILGPKPADSRRKIFGYPIGPQPMGQVIASVKLHYLDDEKATIEKMEVWVYGKLNKAPILNLIKNLKKIKTKVPVNEFVVSLKTQLPLREGQDYSIV